MKKVSAAISVFCLLAAVFAPPFVTVHADEIPQAVDTSSLPVVGTEWRGENPYRGMEAAAKVGESAFAQNCARCHGIQAKSGGIAPDLRFLDRDCDDLKSIEKKKACFIETDKYFLLSIRGGKVRNGAVYMPPFEGFFTQEAMWAIKTYLEAMKGTD